MHYNSSYIITLLTWSMVSDPSSGKIHLCCKNISLKNHTDTFCEQGEISKWGAWSRSAPSSVSGPHLPYACVLQSRGCGSAMKKAVGLDHRPGTRLEDQSICIYVASQPILGVGMVLLWEGLIGPPGPVKHGVFCKTHICFHLFWNNF